MADRIVIVLPTWFGWFVAGGLTVRVVCETVELILKVRLRRLQKEIDAIRKAI